MSKEQRYDLEMKYPRPPWHRRLRNAVLAVATVMGVLQLMLMVPGGGKLPNWMRTQNEANAAASAAATAAAAAKAHPADVARCEPGQDSGCVGGRAMLIMVPPLSEPSLSPASSAGPAVR